MSLSGVEFDIAFENHLDRIARSQGDLGSTRQENRRQTEDSAAGSTDGCSFSAPGESSYTRSWNRRGDNGSDIPAFVPSPWMVPSFPFMLLLFEPGVFCTAPGNITV